MLLFSAIFVAYLNLPEMAVGADSKLVVYKQVDNHFYPSLSFITAQTIVYIPLIIIESTIYVVFTYWMANFAPEADRFFQHWFLCVLIDLVMSSFFRSFAFSCKSDMVAQQMTSIAVAFYFLFAGFLISRNEIPDWLIWLYWLSPFSWIVRSLAITEFHSSRYDGIITAEINGVTITQRSGDMYMDIWQIQNEAYWW